MSQNDNLKQMKIYQLLIYLKHLILQFFLYRLLTHPPTILDTLILNLISMMHYLQHNKLDFHQALYP